MVSCVHQLELTSVFENLWAVCDWALSLSLTLKITSAWAAAIKGIWNRDRESQLDKVKAVQGSHCKSYTWCKQCNGLFENMVIKL